MSFTYLQVTGGGFSVVCSTDISQSVRSKLKNTAGKFLFNGKLTDISPCSRFGMMYAPLGKITRNVGGSLTTCGRLAESCALAAGSLVRTYLRQGKKRELTEKNLLYGVKWQESLARYDRKTCSLRTAQTLLFEGEQELLPTLPRWGTMQDGVVYPGRVWEKPVGKECGLWGSVTATTYMDYKFTKHQVLMSNFGAQRNRSAVQYLKATGDYPSIDFLEWILDFPIGWSALKPLECRKFREWLRWQWNVWEIKKQ